MRKIFHPKGWLIDESCYLCNMLSLATIHKGDNCTHNFAPHQSINNAKMGTFFHLCKSFVKNFVEICPTFSLLSWADNNEFDCSSYG